MADTPDTRSGLSLYRIENCTSTSCARPSGQMSGQGAIGGQGR